VRLHIFDRLSLQRDDQVQDPMCRRVLRPDIDDQVTGIGRIAF
jgi:hypothetical protein